MDSTALTTRADATAMLAREFEPVRIERQLLSSRIRLGLRYCEPVKRISFEITDDH